MANKTNSLSHTKWMCKYHIVFTPKYRRKVIYMVGVPMPEQGTAYIFSMGSANELEHIGRAVLVEANEDEW